MFKPLTGIIYSQGVTFSKPLQFEVKLSIITTLDMFNEGEIQ